MSVPVFCLGAWFCCPCRFFGARLRWPRPFLAARMVVYRKGLVVRQLQTTSPFGYFVFRLRFTIGNFGGFRLCFTHRWLPLATSAVEDRISRGYPLRPCRCRRCRCPPRRREGHPLWQSQTGHPWRRVWDCHSRNQWGFLRCRTCRCGWPE